ncbi:hypothetical protein VP01_8g16 [Puccinia sorghi]|uniref:DDE Tnp4 domain-containing protein n=1 Tax=Puccinia sorghi TaxID=27349 RepID=A0A0L6U7V4_9BASI|nr:hypothetical protein VP01_8g16 [Puccinia sorghi]
MVPESTFVPLGLPSHLIPARSCGMTIGSRQSVLWKSFPLLFMAQEAVGLYRHGHGSSHVTIRHVFNIEKEMADKALGRFVNAILKVFRKHVVRWAFIFTSHCFFVLMFFLPLSFPPLDQPDQWSAIMDSFKNRRGMPKIVGAIDGTHIPISNLPHDEWKGYINRKSSASIVFQCVVDGKGNFLNICGGGAGSMHDSVMIYRGVSHWSQIGQNLRPGSGEAPMITHGTFLIGDAGYSGNMKILHPYPSVFNPANKWFNYIHSSPSQPPQTRRSYNPPTKA